MGTGPTTKRVARKPDGPRNRPPRKKPSPAFPTTSSSLTFSDLSISTTPADLTRLRLVSRAMRDTVAAKRRRCKDLWEKEALHVGCLSAVQRLQRGGRLSRQEYLCEAAARSGQLEELKLLRADGCSWDRSTSRAAAEGGHLEVLQWAHANGCPWDEGTCRGAAEGGHLEVLKWLRANGFIVEEVPYAEIETHLY